MYPKGCAQTATRPVGNCAGRRTERVMHTIAKAIRFWLLLRSGATQTEARTRRAEAGSTAGREARKILPTGLDSTSRANFCGTRHNPDDGLSALCQLEDFSAEDGLRGTRSCSNKGWALRCLFRRGTGNPPNRVQTPPKQAPEGRGETAKPGATTEPAARQKNACVPR